MADLLNLHPKVRAAAAQLVKTMREAGYMAMITSGYRSPRAQAVLRRKYETCLARGRPECLPAARPGLSEHNYGLAVDVVTDAPPEHRQYIAESVGLTYAGTADPVHYGAFSFSEWLSLLKQAGIV